MSDRHLSRLIKEKAILEGADLVGIVPVSRYEGASAMLPSTSAGS